MSISAKKGGIPASEILQKVPPHNTEAEEAVLGGILLEPDQLDKISEVLRAEDFYHSASRTVFSAMIELAGRTGEFDVLTLSNHLEATGLLEEVGGSAFVFSLPDRAVTAANAPHYAQIVSEKALLRQLIHAAGEITASGYEWSGEDINSLLDEAEQSILEIGKGRSKSGFSPMREIAHSSFDLLETQSQAGEVSGIRSGFRDLDKMTMGFQPSDLIIVAARPAMGKTSFALNILENVGVNERKAAAMFSLEMSREQLGIRMLCSHARIDQKAVRQGFLRDPWTSLAKSASVLSDSPIYIDDSPVLTMPEIRSRARQLKVEHDLDILVIDYLQLISSHSGRRNESREREVAEISRSLKQLAKELHIPIIVLAQLNRQVEATPEKRPNLSHLRESGALEQDADLVMFLYRREVYFPEEEEVHGKAEVILGKHRNGPIGSVPVAFHAKFTRFDNLAEDDRFVPPPPMPPGSNSGGSSPF